jgi:hypothetical protein
MIFFKKKKLNGKEKWINGRSKKIKFNLILGKSIILREF